jgi:hypothetical protein
MATIPAAELNAGGGAEDGKSDTDKLKESRRIDAVVPQSAPDLASTFLMFSVSHALGIAAQNAAAFQQAGNVLANAVAAMCASTLLLGGATEGVKAALPEELLERQSAVAPASFPGVASSGTPPSVSGSDQSATLTQT